VGHRPDLADRLSPHGVPPLSPEHGTDAGPASGKLGKPLCVGGRYPGRPAARNSFRAVSARFLFPPMASTATDICAYGATASNAV
jgi:hypothetical protein